MFLKRGLAAALAAVTVIGLAGCGGSDDAAEADTATVLKRVSWKRRSNP